MAISTACGTAHVTDAPIPAASDRHLPGERDIEVGQPAGGVRGDRHPDPVGVPDVDVGMMLQALGRIGDADSERRGRRERPAREVGEIPPSTTRQSATPSSASKSAAVISVYSISARVSSQSDESVHPDRTHHSGRARPAGHSRALLSPDRSPRGRRPAARNRRTPTRGWRSRGGRRSAGARHRSGPTVGQLHGDVAVGDGQHRRDDHERPRGLVGIHRHPLGSHRTGGLGSGGPDFLHAGRFVLMPPTVGATSMAVDPRLIGFAGRYYGGLRHQRPERGTNDATGGTPDDRV